VQPVQLEESESMARFRTWYLGLGGVLLLGLTVVAQQPTVPGFAPTARPAVPADVSPLDEPLRLMSLARQAFQGVQDYSCLLIKRERIRGQLEADEVISMRVRSRPFSVYLHWEAPRGMAGQEACYVVGRNNNMLRVHSTGLAGVIGWISLDPRDPRVLEHSRHSITEAGIGNLLDRYGQRWEEERRLNQTTVRVGDFVYNKRPCRRVEMIHPPGGQYLFYRSMVYFDSETHLPIRVENYDWPRPRGNPDGDLAEVYSYINMQLNVHLGDEAFNY
jgi:hypothetical protein